MLEITLVHLSVVTPVYNEQDCIQKTIRDWLCFLERQNYPWEIIAVNDGSTDQTGEILASLGAGYPNITVIHQPQNSGYGVALKKGISQSRGQWILTIDSDGQFDVADVEGMRKLCLDENLDCVFGVREKRDSKVKVFADRVFRLNCRFPSATALDPNCALKLCRGPLLRSLRLRSEGFSLPTEILLLLSEKGAIFKNTPVQHLRRCAGKSKLNFVKSSLKMALFLIRLRVAMGLNRNQASDVGTASTNPERLL